MGRRRGAVLRTQRIAAIQTHYKGYRFRSRLEARWAVFLDALSEPWEYEKEGYALESGPYLPDFWLPEMSIWLEIKPEEPTSIELKRCTDLAYATGCAVMIGKGIPLERPLSVFCYDANENGGGDQWWDECRFAVFMDRMCINSGWPDDRSFTMPGSYDPFPHMRLSSECSDSCLFSVAANKAKSARFEHGEKG